MFKKGTKYNRRSLSRPLYAFVSISRCKDQLCICIYTPFHHSSGFSGNLFSLKHFNARVEPYVDELILVFEGPVSRLEKDHNWTRPRPEKTGPAVQSFHF